MPPPRVLAELPLMVLSVTIAVVVPCRPLPMPPPSPAELPLMVLFITVSVPPPL